MNYKYLTVILTFICVGCHFVDLDVPATEVESKDIYNNATTAVRPLFDIYATMSGSIGTPFELAKFTGLCGDELEHTWNDNAAELYTNSISSTNLYTGRIWEAAYSNIHNANGVYWGCRLSPTLDSTVKKQLMGEALFLRAYWYFYLFNLYGDIPIPTTTDASKNALRSREPKDVVYAQIIGDLKEAQEYLSPDYVSSDSRTVSTERIRPNKYAATALLARAYLYDGMYNDAEAQADAIITMTSVYKLMPLDYVFPKDSKEAIWQLAPPTPNSGLANASEGFGFVLDEGLAGEKHTISPFLRDAFEEGDQRATHWIGTYTDSTTGNKYYFPYKYKVKSASVVTEYTVMFRLAEMFLIRAECRARQGRFKEATDDINELRKRAGLPILTPQPEMLAAILKERQCELFAEQAHRWFDLKRTGAIDSVMHTVCAAKSGKWSSPLKLWPIPKSELLLAPNLTQNPGY